MTADELMAILARLKGEPAPEYIRDYDGIAQRALNAREQKRRGEWYQELNDDIPF